MANFEDFHRCSLAQKEENQFVFSLVQEDTGHRTSSVNIKEHRYLSDVRSSSRIRVSFYYVRLLLEVALTGLYILTFRQSSLPAPPASPAPVVPWMQKSG